MFTPEESQTLLRAVFSYIIFYQISVDFTISKVYTEVTIKCNLHTKYKGEHVWTTNKHS